MSSAPRNRIGVAGFAFWSALALGSLVGLQALWNQHEAHALIEHRVDVAAQLTAAAYAGTPLGPNYCTTPLDPLVYSEANLYARDVLIACMGRYSSPVDSAGAILTVRAAATFLAANDPESEEAMDRVRDNLSIADKAISSFQATAGAADGVPQEAALAQDAEACAESLPSDHDFLLGKHTLRGAIAECLREAIANEERYSSTAPADIQHAAYAFGQQVAARLAGH